MAMLSRLAASLSTYGAWPFELAIRIAPVRPLPRGLRLWRHRGTGDDFAEPRLQSRGGTQPVDFRKGVHGLAALVPRL